MKRSRPWWLRTDQGIEFTRFAPTSTRDQDLQIGILLFQFHDSRIQWLNENPSLDHPDPSFLSLSLPERLERRWRVAVVTIDRWDWQRHREYVYRDPREHLRDRLSSLWSIDERPNWWSNRFDCISLDDESEKQRVAFSLPARLKLKRRTTR